MFKQYIAIILLCIFNFILVGHSIVPHHHSPEDADHLHTHSHHHHTIPHSDHKNVENDQKEKDGLSDFYSLVVHVSEFVRSENSISTTEQTIQKEESVIAVSSFFPTRTFSATDQKTEGVLYRNPDYSPPPNAHKGLRAPPLFFS